MTTTANKTRPRSRIDIEAEDVEPVPISFPNLEQQPPGSRVYIFGLNNDTGEFEKVGEALVSADGKTVDSIGADRGR